MDFQSIIHDKAHFYKYWSARVAKLLLKNRTAKWSSPILFNDPFDLQIDIGFDFEVEDLIEPFLDEVESLVFSDEEPKGDINHPLFKMILHTRSNRHKQKRNAFRTFMKPACIESSQDMAIAKSELDGWWHTFRQNLRVFCVSEINDDLLMWAHYSDCHRGAVFKLKCIPELDGPLCAAVPILYQDELPIVATKNDYIKHLSGQKSINYDNIFKKFATTKSSHWSYEKEWRCIGYAYENTDERFKFEPVLPQEIDTIYLGCNMDFKDREDIFKLLVGDLKHVQVYQATKHPRKYALQFEKVK